jgi:Fis family transcriptional regulator, factor for inversion stimulation protein
MEKILQEEIKERVEKFFQESEPKNLKNVYEFVMGQGEKILFATVLDVTNNNQFKAAKILNINRGTFRKKLQKYGIV